MWEYITENEYKVLQKTVGRALPSMAIATIKRDENGNPTRAKYRLVVLGNLNPNHWSKGDCYAPVMSQLEFCLLIAISCRLRCPIYTGDFTQAFCQSILPKYKTYIVRPPKDCLFTPPNIYLKLKRTLYGLKRSPRHWYKKASSTLKKLGFISMANSPCIFTKGSGDDTIYFGLYVDDFIYFSKNKSLLHEFEIELQKQLNVDFDHAPSHFLGMKLDCTHNENKTSIVITQPATIEALVESSNLQSVANPVMTPYRSGYPVDKINDNHTLPPHHLEQIQDQYRSIVGLLNWLAGGSRPDIAAITCILSQHLHTSHSHYLQAAKRVVQYLKGTIHKGIKFSSNNNEDLNAFVKYPLSNDILGAQCDAC